MYKTILIATDGSETADKGVAHGLALARDLGSHVIVVTVTEPVPMTIADATGGGLLLGPDDIARYDEGQSAFAARILGSARDKAAALDINAETIHVPHALPAEAVIATAREKEADLIVVASHGRRGLRRLILGSQANEIVVHSPMPVLVVR